MHTVMMYKAIRNGVACTGIGFGIDGTLQATRFFKDGNWDTVIAVMLNWTRDGVASTDSLGEIL
jgi:hypothetical protein